ncbi:Rz1-like lysis system protein LysC [Serratia fonticola]|uniref:Rz1-like lysis system protein LysC n=1 Tax=Serratia fonticola TaxID=47917 RepID=UPI0040329AFA
MLSVSCAEKPKIAPPPKLIYVYPPEVLLQQCEQTPFTGETFGDAVMALQVSQGELDLCASRLEAIRVWSAKLPNQRGTYGNIQTPNQSSD